VSNEDNMFTFKGEARNLCEKRLTDLQCATNFASINNKEKAGQSNDEKEILSFKAIMNSPLSRRYFYQYLESLYPSQHDLVRHPSHLLLDIQYY